jgi:uncharacterized protein with HEPN domain
MLLNDDPTRLMHIIDSAQEAVGFVEGFTRNDLDGNRMLQLSLVRCLEVVGEAAARLSKPLREANPHIPWAAMIGMRNRIVHAYFDIDIDLVWKTATEDLPEIVSKIVTILEKLREEK